MFHERFAKVASFLLPDRGEGIRVHSRPWQIEGAPYYLVNPVRDPDGAGGYLRKNRLDEDGVPFREDALGRRTYHPLIVARYALKQLALAAETGRADYREKARRVLPALVESGRQNGSWGVGQRPDRMVGRRPSAMLQGVVISTILRLTEGAPDADVLGVLERAFEWMTRPIEDGGTLSELAGGPFLEEFPRIPPSHVLNGCFYALFGVYDLADAIGHERAGRIAREVEQTLERSLHLFTTRSGWSFYALDTYGHRIRASLHYHLSHVFLARIVADRTASPAVARQVERWERALHSTPVRLLAGVRKTVQAFQLRYVRRLPLAEG